jgi:ribosome-binding protein aMBF1 (putative translation factor)
MKQIGQLKAYTFDEVKDEIIGKQGSAERDSYEAKLQDELQSYQIGAAIRHARESQNLSQEQLGKMIGVQKAQISRLENGKNITISTMRRVFHAMNLPVKIDMGPIGVFSL